MDYKKQNEKWIIDIFKDCYTDFPSGILIQDEQPDFRVVKDEWVVGIEVAEVFQDSHIEGGSALKQDESVQNKFEVILLDKIQKETEKQFALSVDLNRHHAIGNNNIDDVIEACLPQCLEFLWNEKEGNINIEKYPEDNRFPLPDEIDRIYLQILSSGIPSFNSKSQGGTISNLEFKHIEPSLLKHEKAMPKYKLCNEYWLVIREGNYYAGSFSEIDISLPIISTFNKVFVLRTRQKEVITLK